MSVKRRSKISVVRMVGDAIAAKSKRAVAGLMDGISAAVAYAGGGHEMVHEYTGCQFSDSYGYGIEPRGSGLRRTGGDVNPPNVTFDQHGYIAYRKGAAAFLSPSGPEVGQCRAEITWDGYTRRRRVRRGAAKYTPKRETLPMAYTGNCGYAHTAFPNGTVTCVGDECYGATKLKSDNWKEAGLDLPGIGESEQW